MSDDPAAEAEKTDSAVLMVLVLAYPALLTEEEIRREVREAAHDAADSLARLTAAGLIHRLDGFVFASRAAIHASQLDYS